MKQLKYRNSEGELIPINFYKVNETPITQETGSSMTEVMSQKAVSDELEKKANKEDIPSEYDDTELKNRIQALEEKPDNDTIYDDAEIKERLNVLEAKEGYDDSALWERVNDTYTKEEVDRKVTESGNFDPDQYLTKNEIESTYAKGADVTKEIEEATDDMATQTWVESKNYLQEHQSLANYPTKSEVTSEIATEIGKVEAKIPSLEGYATEEWVENKNYLTVSNLSGYATTEYVDGVKKSILGSDSLNDSYDTLQEVSEWIESHSEEAADVISKQNEFTQWKDNLILTLPYTGSGRPPVFANENTVQLGMSPYNLGLKKWTSSGTTTLNYSIESATEKNAGVMSAEDKQNLDSVVEKIDTKVDQETHSSDLQGIRTQLSELQNEAHTENQTLSEELKELINSKADSDTVELINLDVSDTNSWKNKIKTNIYNVLSPTTYTADENYVYLTGKRFNFAEGTAENADKFIKISQASSERAGIMTAEVYDEIKGHTTRIHTLETKLDTLGQNEYLYSNGKKVVAEGDSISCPTVTTTGAVNTPYIYGTSSDDMLEIHGDVWITTKGTAKGDLDVSGDISLAGQLHASNVQERLRYYNSSSTQTIFDIKKSCYLLVSVKGCSNSNVYGTLLVNIHIPGSGGNATINGVWLHYPDSNRDLNIYCNDKDGSVTLHINSARWSDISINLLNSEYTKIDQIVERSSGLPMSGVKHTFDKMIATTTISNYS